MGLVPEYTFWKANKALYGLRSAPKKWGDKRDSELRTLIFDCKGENVCLEQSETSKRHLGRYASRWEHKQQLGYVLAYVDDMMVVGPTELIETTLDAIHTIWECKVMGTIVKDNVESKMTTIKLVFLSITIEP